ncbi:hypothetical protein PTTG_27279 [Puccinia triticina 1-1 BBBD Race 1]|uniref:Uncharacterized protein n=1 Tax=Puccinia triticina (isolate 1-1 / race 1 (BBBD)) TaxID=630390 RepID=A0A180GLE6_PUCT1|nr:hypothetical protein PTTG_27279 [Puccinia triticina 1-1 BBBD Race 1]
MSHKSRFPQVPQENCSIPGRINCYEKSATNTNSHTAPSVSSDAHLLRDADAGHPASNRLGDRGREQYSRTTVDPAFLPHRSMAQRRSHSQANQLNNRMNHQYKNMRPNQRASFRQQESFRQLNESLLQPRTPRSDAYSHPLEANSPYGPPFPGSSTPRNLPTQPNLQNDWLFMHPTHPVYPSIDF